MSRPKVMKTGSSSATKLPGNTALPFVIPTGAQRSGGTCGLPIHSSLTRAIATLPFVISTGAQRSGEICGFNGPFMEMFFYTQS